MRYAVRTGAKELLHRTQNHANLYRKTDHVAARSAEATRMFPVLRIDYSRHSISFKRSDGPDATRAEPARIFQSGWRHSYKPSHNTAAIRSWPDRPAC
jgi:hypothetical protein